MVAQGSACLSVVAPEDDTLGSVRGLVVGVEGRLVNVPEMGYLTDIPCLRGALYLRSLAVCAGYYRDEAKRAEDEQPCCGVAQSLVTMHEMSLCRLKACSCSVTFGRLLEECDGSHQRHCTYHHEKYNDFVSHCRKSCTLIPAPLSG